MLLKRLCTTVLLAIYNHALLSEGLQQQWIKKGRLKAMYGSMNDSDFTSDSSSISIGESSIMSDSATGDDTMQSDTNIILQHEDVTPDLSDAETFLPFNATFQVARTHRNIAPEISRRQWLQIGALATGGAVTTGLVLPHMRALKGTNNEPSIWKTSIKQKRSLSSSPLPKKKQLRRVNITEVVRETNINITMDCTTMCVSLDRYTFEKKATLQLPGWVPSFLMPPARTIRKVTDSELLVAAIVAGSTVEMVRTSLLYPLFTLKNRLQADINMRVRTRMRRGNRNRLHLKRRAKILKWNVVRHFREGKLYAGLLPSLLVTVPATGVYYSVRDISRRSLSSFSNLSDTTIVVSAALIGIVVSLVVRTPADALALRLQVATGKEQHVKDETEEEAEEAVQKRVGNWFVESMERLPAIVLTDLPYLLSRVALNRYLIHGNIDLAHYELTTIVTALLCALLTTPFDVARTRILADSDDDPTNGIDGGSGNGLLVTMQTIVKEGDGGIANLFAGWLERTLYLAIGRAWLEPLQILGYIAIRDAILLEWFD